MKKKGNVLAIAIMFFLFAMISFVTGLQNPMGIIVKSQFGATNAMSQLGNLANFIAYAFMGLPAGFILNKYGYKITSLAAVAVGFIGVGISFLSGVAESFAVYLIGAFVSGFSMCMLNTVVNPMLNTLGGGGNKGNQLIQFGGSLNSLAATIVPVLVGYLIGEVTAETAISDANPALFIAMGVFAVAFVIILFSYIPEPELEASRESSEPKESTMESVSKALSHKNLVFGVIAIFLYVGIEVGIPNIANLYMTSPEVGMSAGVAGTVVGMYWLLMLCGRLLGGVIGGKVSSKVGPRENGTCRYPSRSRILCPLRTLHIRDVGLYLQSCSRGSREIHFHSIRTFHDNGMRRRNPSVYPGCGIRCIRLYRQLLGTYRSPCISPDIRPFPFKAEGGGEIVTYKDK